MKRKAISIQVEVIERKILLIRGQKVMLDSDLAALYGVPTKRLNQQVRRNIVRGRGGNLEVAICNFKMGRST